MKILVIEDERDVWLNIAEILESGGFDTIHTEDGLTGLRLAREKSPDLIVCDVKMADFDGYCVLAALRQDPLTAAIPFIFLSAEANKAEVREGMNLGADDYLTKPLRPLELLATIAARLKRHSAQADLQEKGRLQEMSIQNNDLVNTITHDLRAPLTTIKVALKLMAALPDNLKQYTEIALVACDQGEALIQNLLDLYRVESGETLAIPEPLDLKEHFRKIIDSFQVCACDYQQVLIIDLPETLPTIVYDPVSLQRIFVELLNNAGKYTPGWGEIIFKIREFTQADQTPALRFTVSNQSEISCTDLPHIFDKFYRASGSDRRKQSGTGLGLALVKKLVEQLQGSIQVNSENGWTTFVVDLPFQTL